MTLLTSGAASSVANLSLVLTSYTAYRALMILLDGWVPASTPVDLRVTFSTDGGSTYLSTNYNRSVQVLRDNNTADSTGTANAQAELLLSSTGASSRCTTGSGAGSWTIWFPRPLSNSVFPRIQFDGVYFSDGGF